MFRIGLTGGIASGKSTVADLFAARGATVIDTDVIAREIVEPGSPVLDRLVDALGSEILDRDRSLDRAGLRQRMFADPDVRRRVESILHPAILTELNRRSESSPGPYQVLVIPLLVEGERAGLVDRVLVVDCPEALQIERLMRRDGESYASAERMLAAQASRDARRGAADDLIVNDGPPGELADQVAILDRKYREMAARH
jgi:dephospho-CoA kinase